MDLRQEKRQFVQDLLKMTIKGRPELEKYKNRFCKRFGIEPIRNSELREIFKELEAEGVVEPNKEFERLLLKRAVRTISGIASISTLVKPFPCPGKCIFCPTEFRVPKSYLSNEPGVMRAIALKYNPYKQVMARLKAYHLNGHHSDKIELIVQGGTWSFYPYQYKFAYVKKLFDACNDGIDGMTRKTTSLEESQRINETAKHRVVGLTIETRPDYINEKEIQQLRKLGVTRIEIGVQNLYNDVLKLNKRGHTIERVIAATKMLKEAGFKIVFHMMPNLAGATPERDLQMFKDLFSNPDFQPDMLKVYPCAVLKNAQLYTWWKEGRYQSYDDQTLFDLSMNILRAMPYYVRINRFIRDIPTTIIESGNPYSNLRQMLEAKMAKNGEYCKDIRAREARGQSVNPDEVEMFIQKYDASGGTEYFLSFESKDRRTLYAFLRLRLNESFNHYIPELRGAALVREIHTYGQLVPIDTTDTSKVQHVGFGKRLLAKAEEIAAQHHATRVAVISGVGVREYYRKRGYHLEGTYMVKDLISNLFEQKKKHG